MKEEYFESNNVDRMQIWWQKKDERPSTVSFKITLNDGTTIHGGNLTGNYLIRGPPRHRPIPASFNKISTYKNPDDLV